MAITTSPKIFCTRNGAGAVTGDQGDALGTSYDFDDINVAGADEVKLRFHHAQSDSTSITVKCTDATATSLTSASPAALLSVRQSNNSTALEQAIAAANEPDDALCLALGGTVTTLRVYTKRTGGTGIAGNKIQIEARFTEVR